MKGLTYQIHGQAETAFCLVFPNLGHTLCFTQTPDMDLPIDARGRKIIAIGTEGNGPDVAWFDLVCELLAPFILPVRP